MADGYNTESSEQLHIDYAKDAYQASNKKDYLRQMTVWLGWQEAVAQFTAFQDYLTKCELAGQMDVLENGDEESLDGNEAEDEDDVVASTLQLRYMLAVKPGFPSLWIHTHNHFWFPCPRLHLLFINSHPMCLPPSVSSYFTKHGRLFQFIQTSDHQSHIPSSCWIILFCGLNSYYSKDSGWALKDQVHAATFWLCAGVDWEHG